MTASNEAAIQTSAEKLQLPEAPLSTPEQVRGFIDQQIAADPVQHKIASLEQPTLERQSVAAVWEKSGIGFDDNARARLAHEIGAERGEVSFDWINVVDNSRLPFEGTGSVHNFRKEQFDSPDDFTNQIITTYRRVVANRRALKTSRQMLEGAARTVDELKSAATVWIEEVQEFTDIAVRVNPDAAFSRRLLKSLVDASKRLAEAPDETRSPVDIVAETLMTMHAAAGERGVKTATAIHRTLMASHDDYAIPEAETIYDELISRGLSEKWSQPPEARFVLLEENGAIVRRYTEEGLNTLYETVVNGAETELLGKKPKRDVLAAEATYIIEDTIASLATSESYAQVIAQALRKLAGRPQPGRVINASFAQITDLSNSVVNAAMDTLPKDRQLELTPLKPGEMSSVADAFTRLLYMINPELLDRSEGKDTYAKEQLFKRVELVNALIERALNMDGRPVSVGDFVLQRTVEGVSAAEISQEVNGLLADLEKPVRKGTEPLHGRDRIILKRRGPEYYKRHTPGYGIQS